MYVGSIKSGATKSVGSLRCNANKRAIVPVMSLKHQQQD